MLCIYIPEDNAEQVLALFHRKLMTRAIPSSFYYSDMLLGIMVQAAQYYYMLISSYNSHRLPQNKALHSSGFTDALPLVEVNKLTC